MTNLDYNYHKIRRISDLHDLSYLFFPQKTAHNLRSAFIAIIIEIKNHPQGKIANTICIRDKYDIPMPGICKARARMRKYGLIEYRNGYWQLSSRFSKGMQTLVTTWQDLTHAAETGEQKQKERFLVDIAKA